MDRNKLLMELYGKSEGYIELRALPLKRTTFIPLDGDWTKISDEVDGFCKEFKEQNIYFGIATRDGKGGKKDNVVNIPCVWADIDFKDIPEEEFDNRLKVFFFKPTIITKSGNGVHLYFLLESPVELKDGSEVERVNRWIASELSGDNTYNIDRILRLPNTVNHKYEHKPLCEIIEINTGTFRLDDFIWKIPEQIIESVSENKTIERRGHSTPNGTKELETQVEAVTGQVEEKEIVLGDDSYDNWLRIGFALVDGLGEGGRRYYHRISIFSDKYDEEECDKKYDNCLGGNGGEDRITIATLFYYAKEAGLEIGMLTTTDITAKSPAISTTFNITDLGNAKRLVETYGDIIRYSHLWKKWLVWDEGSGVWQVDNDGEIIRLAKQVVLNIYSEAISIEEEERRRKVAKWAVTSESGQHLRSMVQMSESEKGVYISPDELNTDTWLLNCQNGTIDLQTGKLKEHDKDDLITRVVSCEYNPKANCPTWIKFLYKIMKYDAEMVSFLKRSIGYSSTGVTNEQCLFLLYGVGANGKSTFLNTISDLFGDYSQTASFDSFLTKKFNTNTNDLARMQGMRFISAVEAESERRLSEVLIKQLTGGDTISARFLYSEFFDFKPQFKLWLAANHKPTIKGTDHAIWRRIKLIPFSVTIPDEEQDKGLTDKLREELPGILSWVVQGCLEWQKNGLTPPDKVVASTREYREEMDEVGDFLEECCVVEASLKVNPTELYIKYKEWCDQNGANVLTVNVFGMRLTERGLGTKQAGGKRYRLGVGLLEKCTASTTGTA